MAKQTFSVGQVLSAAQMSSLQATAMGGGTPQTKTASYTLVAADAGTVIQMNSASSTTITVNTSLFSAGDSVQIQNIGAGTCTITAGTATVNSAGSLAVTQYDGGFLYFSSASSALWFDYTQAGTTSPLTTKGDLYTRTSSADARLAVGTNGYTLVADSAEITGLKWQAPSSGSTFVGVKAYSSTSQSISNNTVTAVTFWDTEDFDTDAIHSTSSNPSRFTVPAGKSGKWAIQSALLYQSGTAGERRVRIYKNGVFQMDSRVDPNTGGTSVNVSNVYNLVATDYLEIYAYQNTGVSKNIDGGGDGNSFVSMYYLGA